MDHPKRSAPPKSSSSSTGFGSSFLTSFFGYYFLAGLLSAALAGALPADPDPDPTFAVPALINLIYGDKLRLRVFCLSTSQRLY